MTDRTASDTSPGPPVEPAPHGLLVDKTVVQTKVEVIS